MWDMTSSRGSPSSESYSASRNFIQSCFYPNTSGEEAEAILKSVGKNGSFLLRLCNRVNGCYHYVLSVMNNQQIIHLKLQCDNDHYSMCGEEFESPYDVINCCMDNPDILKGKDGNIIELKQPIINARKLTRWYHDNIYPKDADRILNENGKYGSYLVRSSYRHPGDYALCVRLKNENVCVKIYANGEKFDIGAGGKQFNSINDLILHYKKYPLKTNKGVDIHLDQGIDSDSVTTDSTEKNTVTIPSIDWPDKYCIVTLSAICTRGHGCQGKANGMIQVCKGQNGTMTINLNGSKNSSSLACCQFRMYKALMDPDDIGHSYDVICLESCAHPGSYIYWNQQSVKIYSTSSGSGGTQLPPAIRGICWFRHSTKTSCCECASQRVQAKVITEASTRPLNACSTHKLAAWTDRPCQQNVQYCYLTFNATDKAPEDHTPRLTTDFSFSSDVEFCGDTDDNFAQSND